MRGKFLWLALLAGLVVETCALICLILFNRWKAEGVSAVQRGYQVAEQQGCFTCHGYGGTAGVPNPGSQSGAVPAWNGGTYMMFVSKGSEIREWILNGLPKRLEQDAEYMAARNNSLLMMPSYKGKISSTDLKDLIAYFKATAWADKPADENTAAGREEASEYGCFNCHGPSGRGTRSNPGSLKGYIPGWDGADFRELVKNDDELQQWIMNGISDRFKKTPPAMVFLRRAPVKMPAYKEVLKAADYEKIKAYIHWLQRTNNK